MYSRVVFATAALVSLGTISSPLFAHDAASPAAPAVSADRNAGVEGQGASGVHPAAAFVAFAAWNARVQRLLQENVEYPQGMSLSSPGTGVVRVKFDCSESGRPDKVSISRSSGNGLLDQAALRAVSRVATLHPLPTGFSHGQRFEAQVVFASSEKDARLKTMSAEQARRKRGTVTRVRKRQPVRDKPEHRLPIIAPSELFVIGRTKPAANGDDDKMRPVGRVQLVSHVDHVGFDGAGHDMHLGGDDLRRMSRAEGRQHLTLA